MRKCERELKDLAEQNFKEGFMACRMVIIEILFRTFMGQGFPPQLVAELSIIKEIQALELLINEKGPIQ